MSVTEEVPKPTTPVDPAPPAALPVTPKDIVTEYVPVADAPQAVIVTPDVTMSIEGVDQNGLLVGKWKADICSCFTNLIPNCCMAYWCPCISLAQTVHRVGLYSYTNTLIVFGVLYLFQLITWILAGSVHGSCSYSHDSWGYYSYSCTTISVWFYIMWVISVIVLIFVMMVRIKVREMFKIPGNHFEDSMSQAQEVSFTPPSYVEQIPVMDATPQVLFIDNTVAGAVDLNGLVVGRWKADLCGCFTDLIPNCCMAYWCPCFSIAQIVHRIGIASYSHALIAFGVLYGASIISMILSSQTGVTCGYNGIYYVCISNFNPWIYISFLLALSFRNSSQDVQSNQAGEGITPNSTTKSDDCNTKSRFYGASIDPKDQEGSTPLHKAAFAGQKDVVKLLIHGGASVNDITNAGWTALHFAACAGQIEVVEMLLTFGANIEARDNNLQTPLHKAALDGREAVVDMLIKAGAVIDSKDEQDCTPLDRAISEGHIKVIELLINADACVTSVDEDGRTKLHFAAYEGYEEIIKLILKSNKSVDPADKEGRTPLQYAASEGHDAVVALLLDAGASVDSKDKDGCSPLYCAAFEGNAGVVDLLIHYGASTDATDNKEWECFRDGPLTEKHEEVMELLRQAGRVAMARGLQALSRHFFIWLMSVTDEVPGHQTPTSEYVKTQKESVPVVEAAPFAQPAPPHVVIVEPTVAMEAAMVDQNGLIVGKWKSDICGCCNDLIPNCCMVYWCPCVSLAQILHRVGLYTYTNALVVLLVLFGGFELTAILAKNFTVYVCGYYTCAYSFSFWSFISSIFCIGCVAVVMYARMRIRGMFQIPGNACEDCLCACFCSCCAIAQMATQTDSYTPSQCDFAAKDTLPGYVA
ncbi:ankyrin 2,3/unc44 [Thraustotheca clavata]|uniref:Ankyrin 2,3/unc44 n=1 Tax=Thraustotheca clavata TaxID=74557 RepID=A0A1V9ZN41_9STRA|nr:ankyrin 2,3/unc44 [Thraustotheca clavata]